MLIWFVILYGVVLLIAGRRIPRLYELYVNGIPTTGLTYLPEDPSINVAGDVKDLLREEYDKCEEWAPWTALAVIVLFIWNVLLRSYWFAQTPFAGSRFDRFSRFLFGD